MYGSYRRGSALGSQGESGEREGKKGIRICDTLPGRERVASCQQPESIGATALFLTERDLRFILDVPEFGQDRTELRRTILSAQDETYAARLAIDYPEQLDRVTTLLRIIWIIPIVVIVVLVGGGGGEGTAVSDSETMIGGSGGGIAAGLSIATALMIVFRMRYPRWWFDFARELTRFEGRVVAYLALLTDRFPSTVDEQSVHLEIDYPDVEQDLNRWLPLVKWLLAIPHYVVLVVLFVLAVVAVVIAWFAILFTGRYPEGLFNFVVGVARWALRVQAYAFLLVTDRYPPFSMD